MSDEEIKFKLDLDTKAGVTSATEFLDAIKKIGDSKNLDGLIGGFTSILGPIAVAGGAALVFKQALDFTLEAESIQRIENQFQTLSAQAGVSADDIEKGIKKATAGTVDMTDALQAANKAMITLGPSAKKIPELFELARKSAQVFGGDTIANFDQLSQGIAAGNVRMLKHLGIIVDVNKAQADYAKSVGTTSGALSQQEKQQALMNAVLQKGQDNYKNVSADSSSATVALQKMTTAFKELYESIAKAASSSGFFAAVMTKVGAGVQGLANDINALGNPAKQAQVKVNDLTTELERLQKIVDDAANKKDKTWMDRWVGSASNIEQTKREIAEITEKLKIAQVEKDKLGSEETTEKPAGTAPVDLEAQRLRATQKAKFESELLQLQQSRLKAEMENETEAGKFREDLEMQEFLVNSEYEAKEEQLRLKGKEGKELSAQQANEEIMQLEEEKNARLKSMRDNENEEILKAYHNQAKQAKTLTDGVKAGFAEQGAIAKKNLNDFGKTGTTVFNAVNKGAVGFFKGLGDGSKDAGTLMKQFLLGALADIAQAQGEELLAYGIGSFNGVAIAEGGALIALSEVLRSSGGGGSGSGGGSGGGSSGGSGPMDSSTALKPDTTSQQQKKTVNVQFMGDYLETSQTKQLLVDLIRQETDATDFKYQQIGVS